MIKWIIAADTPAPASSAAGSSPADAWWLAEHPAQVPTLQP
jgi:hypothetical protein